MLELYQNIRKFRLLNKMTQDELAKKTGYTDRSSIAKIERGDVDLPQSKIMLFAAALNINAGDLMGNSGIVSTTRTLTQDEAELLDVYGQLNDEGQNKVIDYANDLNDSGRYKKYNTVPEKKLG